MAVLVSARWQVLEVALEELQQRQQALVRAIDAGWIAAARLVGLTGHLAVIEAAAKLGGGA